MNLRLILALMSIGPALIQRVQQLLEDMKNEPDSAKDVVLILEALKDIVPIVEQAALGFATVKGK